jgi:hypothetical protein
VRSRIRGHGHRERLLQAKHAQEQSDSTKRRAKGAAMMEDILAAARATGGALTLRGRSTATPSHQGPTEQEQLERALQASLADRGAGGLPPSNATASRTALVRPRSHVALHMARSEPCTTCPFAVAYCPRLYILAGTWRPWR